MSAGQAFAGFGLGEAGAGLAFDRPRQILAAQTLAQVAPVVQAAHAAALAGHWVLGMVAYEAAPAFDAALQTRPPLADLPLAWFAVYDAPSAEAPAEAAETLVPQAPWRAEIDRQRFADDIAAIHADIRAGRYYQSNHTTRLRSTLKAAAAGSADGSGPRALFAELCAAQPSNYRLFLDAGDWQVLSVSPELFFDWQPEGLLTTRPMKGTAPRSDDPARDAEAAASLQASAKERAENLMIVDLLRNDLSRLARLGSVEVSGLFAVEALPSLWQMTSTVSCRSLPGLGLADVFAALFPCGSVTGAPKVTAMQVISERERSPRGPYCGALGVIRPGGHATFSVSIRTVLLRQQGEQRQAECGIGSGITIGASAAGEFAEWQAKRRFLNRAGAGFQLLETLRLENGDYFLLAGHLARLAASAEHFGFACDSEKAQRELAAEAARLPPGAYRIRLLLNGKGHFSLESYPLLDLPPSREIRLASSPVASDDEFLHHKTTARQTYEQHTIPPGCLDVLLYNERDELTEFTRANLILEIDGQRLTPAASSGLLPGAMRAELLGQGEIREAILHKADLERATAIWWVNSVRGMVPVELVASAGLTQAEKGAICEQLGGETHDLNRTAIQLTELL